MALRVDAPVRDSPKRGQASQNAPRTLLLVLGDQLFDPQSVLHERPSEADRQTIVTCFMAEDLGLCTHFRYHQQKIVFFLTAMREHANALRLAGFPVHYEKLSDRQNPSSYFERLKEVVTAEKIERILCFEVEDRFFETELQAFATERGLLLQALASPMFLTSRGEFFDFRRRHKKLLMKSFYEEQRKRLGILVDSKGEPDGGRWSFDTENRLKLPQGYKPNPVQRPTPPPLQYEVETLVAKGFPHHPGTVEGLHFPTCRSSAVAWLKSFLETRFRDFGAYEDAFSDEDPFINHSLLTPLLNSGLLTPKEVVASALHVAKSQSVPMASLEGFVRQVIGWREFIRGVYQTEGARQESLNFWGHQRQLKSSWYDGSTGLAPLDGVIKKTLRYGYAHHIERLMIVGNLMLLCEVEPRAAHRWFMEMFIDSADWVMGPNVYGMGIFSDGGIFATKPYICGSNYLLKMGYRQKGEWTEVMDGLYWRFIGKNRPFFSKNPRLSMMVRLYEKMSKARREHLDALATQFINQTTSL